MYFIRGKGSQETVLLLKGARVPRVSVVLNKGIKSKPFTTDDLCYVQIRCTKHKFAPRWLGPVRIVKAVNEHVYVVKIGEIEKVVNISKLKKYQPD